MPEGYKTPLRRLLSEYYFGICQFSRPYPQILVAELSHNEIWTRLPAAERLIVSDVSPDAACLGVALRFRVRGSGRLQLGPCGDDEESRTLATSWFA